MTADSPLGEVARADGRTTLRFARSLRHRREKVWRALTESQHLRWWMPVDMIGERAAGATVQMVFWPDLVATKHLDPDGGTATIRVWEPPAVFELDWHGSRIRFELLPTADGCELLLRVEIDDDDPETIIDNAGGYHQWLDHLLRLLDTGSGTSIADGELGSRAVDYRSALNED